MEYGETKKQIMWKRRTKKTREERAQKGSSEVLQAGCTAQQYICPVSQLLTDCLALPSQQTAVRTLALIWPINRHKRNAFHR